MIAWRNSTSSYGLISIAIHWLMAIAVFAMFALGLWMRTLDYYHDWYHAAPYLHKGMGVLLLLALLFRLGWRISNTRPELMGQNWEQSIALMVHRLHYLLLFALMITGYLIPTAEGVGIDVFGYFTLPALLVVNKDTADLIGLAHLYLAWSAIGLATAHAGAAFKHHFIDHDNTLRRMMGMRPNTKEGK